MNENSTLSIIEVDKLFTSEGIKSLVNANTVVEKRSQEIFHQWVRLLRNEEEKLTIDNLKITDSCIQVETSYPTWGGGREHGYYEMPIKYLLCEDYMEMINRDVAARDAEAEEEASRQAIEDQLRAEQALEDASRKEREEYGRLHAIYGSSENNEGKA